MILSSTSLGMIIVGRKGRVIEVERVFAFRFLKKIGALQLVSRYDKLYLMQAERRKNLVRS